MIELVEDKREIDKIIYEEIKGKRIVFSSYYERISFMRRGITEEMVLEVLPQFNKVIKIIKQKLKFGDIGYELFYGLSNNLTFSIATIPTKEKVEIIHAIEYKRKLDYKFKRFKQ